MIGKEDSGTTNRLPTSPGELEVAQLPQEAEQQYEECIRLAELADMAETGEASQPKYAWDNPLGLVVAGPTNAKLVLCVDARRSYEALSRGMGHGDLSD